jgi:4-amino-4-deoxy-L-arabinose transferase-like glycosyltransferase
MKLIKKEYIVLFILAIFCLVFYFLFLGHYKLIDVDEPRYAEAAREMLESGNWLTPYFNYELRFDKPIFIYWLIALSYKLFGITEFAARFPSAVASALLVFSTYFFGRQTVSKSFGFISALILASSVEFIVLGRMSITDMTLAFFICATIFAGFLADFSHKKEKSKSFWDKYCDVIYWNFAYLFSGAAVLTKGPIGFILPAIIFAISFLLTGSLKRNLKLKYIIPGLFIFSAVTVPWYYLIIKEHGMNFVNYFFLKHNLTRFGGGSLGHEQPFYFYPLVIFLGTFPWMFYFMSALIKYTFQIADKFKNLKLNNISIFKDADNNLKVILYSCCWFFTVLFVFSASSAKLLTYILPLFPAFALLTGKIWQDYIENDIQEKAFKYASIFTVSLCFLIAIGLIAAYIIIKSGDQTFGLNFQSLAIPLLIISSMVLFIFSRHEKIKSFYTLPVMMGGVIILVITAVMPVIYNSAQADLIKYINLSKNYNSGDNEFITLGIKKPSLVFYFQKRVVYVDINDTEIINKYLQSEKPVFIVTKKKYLSDLSEKLKYNLISTGKRYSLISNIDKLKER